MKELVKYIQDNISGIWENEDYSLAFTFNPNDLQNNTGSWTSKIDFPKTGAQCRLYITENETYPLLRMVFTGSSGKMESLSFLIQKFDASANQLELLHNGVEIKLYRA